MSKTEVSLSDRTESNIQRLVDQGEFLNWEQAVEELLTRGVSAYGGVEEEPGEVDDDLFTQAVGDQQDPAREDPDDDYGF